MVEPGNDPFGELTGLLSLGIPLSAAAGISVVIAGPDVFRIKAPFDPNRNYHGTVFGGSQSVVGIVAGWLMVDACVKQEKIDADVVIQSSRTDFLKPANGDIEAVTSRPGAVEWARFVETLQRRGKGRIEVTGEVTSGGQLVARHLAVYAAVTKQS